jgi:hypothetical protein
MTHEFHRKKKHQFLIITLILIWIAYGCSVNLHSRNFSEQEKLPTHQFPATPTPFQPLFQEETPGTPPTQIENEPTQTTYSIQTDIELTQNPTATIELLPSPTTQQATLQPTSDTQDTFLWVDPTLPKAFQEKIVLPEGVSRWQQEETKPQSDLAIRLEVGDGQVISRWVYALVAPFPTITQAVSADVLHACWKGEAVGPFAGKPMLLDQSTLDNFTKLWGAPAEKAVKVVPADQILATAWERRSAWAIIPFEAIESRWKVIEVENQSPLRKDFNAEAYPLVLPISLVGSADQVAKLQTQSGINDFTSIIPATNRDPSRLTVVAVTGVTALVRATAYTMEQKGILYPGKDVREWLRQADITHISNEVPFARGCPYPDPVQQGMRFCSDPRYIALLEDVGTDVVELTGDHFQDWGEAAMLYTLQMYKERNWSYYGGGANSNEARQPIKIEHNGNKIAFIGCNAKGGSYAQAAPKHPGAVVCDLDSMAKEIQRLRSEGYLPIATFQHFEYYTYKAQPNQVHDSRQLAEAGAVIISGSQAHQPQAFEFYQGALIHYGLGNMFFDQYDVSQATRQGFIDLHVFYNGQYLGVELLPIMFIDYARPRPMTQAESSVLLRAIFKASGW